MEAREKYLPFSPLFNGNLSSTSTCWIALGKGKSDRQDAQWLPRYAQQPATPRWQPEEAGLVECRQLAPATELLIRQKTRGHQALQARQGPPVVSPTALKQLRQALLQLEEPGPPLEAELFAPVLR